MVKGISADGGYATTWTNVPGHRFTPCIPRQACSRFAANPEQKPGGASTPPPARPPSGQNKMSTLSS